MIVKDEGNGEATFKQSKKYGETTVTHPLNPRYPDIELKKRFKYRIVGKVVKKEKTILNGELSSLANTLMKDLQDNSEMRQMNYKKYGLLNVQVFAPRLSKPIIDRINRVLAKHYGFTDEELDFIINYDIKYRMGRNSEEE